MKVREYEWVKEYNDWFWVQDHLVRTEAELDAALRACAARHHRGEVVTLTAPREETMI